MSIYSGRNGEGKVNGGGVGVCAFYIVMVITGDMRGALVVVGSAFICEDVTISHVCCCSAVDKWHYVL